MVIDSGFWSGRRVCLTGHTGFKGAWTALLLGRLGAEVHGFALPPERDEDLFHVAGVAGGMHSLFGDIREPEALQRAVGAARPEIVVHMAAQALVRRSYAEPLETYGTNVMGTAHVLEAVRGMDDVKAVIIVTSDKCYAETDGSVGHRETDPLGGFDPYASSKGCAELVTAAYRNSYFGGEGAARVASVRAGNVIGGGDWAADRLVPDAMRAFLAGETLLVRNPAAVRPWQHVLDPVIAYLALAERLAAGAPGADEAWNFGPGPEAEVTVECLLEAVVRHWGEGARWLHDQSDQPRESHFLALDCTKARERLGWQPLIDLERAVQLTVEWYRAFEGQADLSAVTRAQIDAVLDGATAPAADAALQDVR